MKNVFTATVIAAALAFPLHANAQVKLGAYAIPGVIETNKSGDYDKIIAKIGAVTGNTINYEVLPAAQLESAFRSGKIDCFFPLDARFWDGKEKLNSEPLNVAKIYIFSKAYVAVFYTDQKQ